MPQAKEIVEPTRCPFCTGHFSVAEDITDGQPMVMHTYPVCSTFTALEPTDYLAKVNNTVLASRLGKGN